MGAERPHGRLARQVGDGTGHGVGDGSPVDGALG